MKQLIKFYILSVVLVGLCILWGWIMLNLFKLAVSGLGYPPPWTTNQTYLDCFMWACLSMLIALSTLHEKR